MLVGAGLLFFTLLCSPAALAQDDSSAPKGIESGGYNISQTVEFGYRSDWINGNQDTYDTFVNLGQGVRLFDYSLDMRSLHHDGLLFDNLSFSNFGYGGDPNDVSRLRVDKGKWYDFQALVRRDKNFWDWNLWANPLNPISTNPTLSPTTPAANSPHALDLVRLMQDYNLTLLPQSRFRIRLGYSRVRENGPGFYTTDGGTISPFNENYSNTTNAYHMGVDFKVVDRTTVSYDQTLSYYKQDNFIQDQNFPFQVVNGGITTPVDLGDIWASSGGEILPCAVVTTPPTSPLQDPTTNPPTANPNCNGFVSYSQAGRPRNFMPTELLRFQSNYFKKFETSGSFAYSFSNNTISDFNETVVGWTTRSASPGGTTSGPAQAKRYTVTADWNGTYAVTDNLRIVDQFRFDNWRIPTQWDSLAGSFFTTGGTGLGAPIGIFNSDCNVENSYSGPTCPSHTSSNGADQSFGFSQNYFAQDLRTNTLELEYDISRRYSVHVGWLYSFRKITDQSNAFNTLEIYYPGGVGADAGNFYLAARGDCAITGGGLPAGCSQNPNGDGSLIFNPGPPTGLEGPSSTIIKGNAAIFGVVARPIDSLRITGDFEFGSNDFAFTRTSPRQVQSYRVNARYTPNKWANISGAVDIHENRDNVYTVDNLEHDRMYSISTILLPNSRLSFNFGYNYWDVYSQADVCYSEGFGPPPPGTTPCPSADSPVPLGALATYTSTDHFAYAGLSWRVNNRVTANLGFDGSFVRGTSPYFNQPQFAAPPAPALQQVTLNQLQPSGTLNFNYLTPSGSIAVDLYKGITYKMAWNYYGYDISGTQFPTGLALSPTNPALPSLQLENFNGSTATFSLRYAF